MNFNTKYNLNAKIKFRQSTNKNEYTIYLRFYSKNFNQGNEVLVSTKMNINKDLVNTNNRKFTFKRKADFEKLVIENYITKCNKYIADIISNKDRYPTAYELKIYVNNQLLHNYSTTDQNSIKTLFNKYLEHCENKGISESTLYRRRTKLKSFVKRFGSYNVKHLTSIEVVEFVEKVYYNLKNKRGKELAKSTINNDYIMTLKNFLNYLFDKDKIDTKIGDRIKRLEINTTYKNIITLDNNELSTLINYRFKDKKTQKQVDNFIFSALTGLRYSELKSISDKHTQILFNEDENYYKLHVPVTQKNKDVINAPLHEYALKILNKYDRKLTILHNQETNEVLRKACKEVDLNRIVTRVKETKTNIQRKTRPLHDLITFHSARATTVTRLYKNKASTQQIKNMTRHVKDETVRHYTDIFNTEDDKYILEKINTGLRIDA